MKRSVQLPNVAPIKKAAPGDSIKAQLLERCWPERRSARRSGRELDYERSSGSGQMERSGLKSSGSRRMIPSVKKTAVIYVRVSSDEQVENTSLETQETACRRWLVQTWP